MCNFHQCINEKTSFIMKLISKKYILAAALLASVGTTMAQDFNSAYFIDDYKYRHDLNPAFGNDQSYVSLPALGNLTVKMQGNYGIDGVIFKNPNPNGKKTVTFLHPDITWDQVKGNLKDNNKLSANVDITILSAGFKGFGGYNTIEINEKTSFGLQVPLGLFEFAKNTGNNRYDFSDLRVRALSYGEIAFGHSRQITQDLRVGAKVKILLGLGRANMEMNNVTADLTNTNQWLITGQAKANFNVKGMTLKEKEKKYNNKPGKYKYVSELDVDGTGLNGFGLGLDLGATYKMDNLGVEGLTLSAALTDLGFISWSNNIQASNHGETFVFNGFHDISVNEDRDNNTIDKQADDYSDQLADFANLQNDGDQGSESSMLAATARLGAEYILPVYKPVSFGLLLQHRFDGDYSWSEGRLSANYKPLTWIDGGVNVAVNSFTTSAGWVLNIHPKAFNFFIGMDHILGKTTKEFIPLSSNMSVNLGMNVTF